VVQLIDHDTAVKEVAAQHFVVVGGSDGYRSQSWSAGNRSGRPTTAKISEVLRVRKATNDDDFGTVRPRLLRRRSSDNALAMWWAVNSLSGSPRRIAIWEARRGKKPDAARGNVVIGGSISLPRSD
jgi:hypothetical protein